MDELVVITSPVRLTKRAYEATKYFRRYPPEQAIERAINVALEELVYLYEKFEQAEGRNEPE